MSDFKYSEVPSFTKRDGNAIVYSGDGELDYYIPEEYFEEKSSPIASIEGAYVRLFGSFSYRIVSKSGKAGEVKLFTYPTSFLCKPNSIDKVKGVQLDNSSKPQDYRVLSFLNGDQLVTDVFTAQNIDNTRSLLSAHIMTGKIPKGIPYNQLYKYPYESMILNGNKFDIHSQLMGLIYSKICRDPKDISKPYRLSKAIDADKEMINYSTISVKEVPKYTSPYAAITSENIDEGIMSSVILTDDIEEGNAKSTYSPLEQVIMM